MLEVEVALPAPAETLKKLCPAPAGTEGWLPWPSMQFAAIIGLESRGVGPFPRTLAPSQQPGPSKLDTSHLGDFLDRSRDAPPSSSVSLGQLPLPHFHPTSRTLLLIANSSSSSSTLPATFLPCLILQRSADNTLCASNSTKGCCRPFNLIFLLFTLFFFLHTRHCPP